MDGAKRHLIRDIVVAGTAIEDIEPAAIECTAPGAVEPIIACAAIQYVIARSAFEIIVFGAAIQNVVAGFSIKRIETRPSVEVIISSTTIESVVTCTAIEGIGTRCADEDIIAGSRLINQGLNHDGIPKSAIGELDMFHFVGV